MDEPCEKQSALVSVERILSREVKAKQVHYGTPEDGKRLIEALRQCPEAPLPVGLLRPMDW